MKTFSPELDKKSENVIYLLSLNSRQSVSDVSKILLLNRKIVENRINKLYSQELIKPLLIYNHKGLIKATILIKLSNFDQQTIKNVEKVSNLVKLKETLGSYDISLFIITENEEELQEKLDQLNKLFHNSMQNIDVVKHDMEDTLGYKSFCHNTGLLSKYRFLNTDKRYELTEDDRKLISLLKIKPDISYRNLIGLSKLSYLKIKKTISNLSDKGIIRFSIDPNYNKLGLEFHNALIRINQAKKEEFERNILKNRHVHWFKSGSGRWDYILSICSRDVSEFIDISRDIRTSNKDSILEFSSLVSKINVTRKH